MKKIGVKNFRAFEDSGIIDLKPITVLVGRNSSGKSSFIRLFPLLKQSLETRIAESLLWYGEYVDFGTYENVICNKNLKNSNIELYFEFETISQANPFRSISPAKYDVIMQVVLNKYFFEKIIIKLYDQKIEINYNENNLVEKILINDSDCFKGLNIVCDRNYKSFIPVIKIIDDDNLPFEFTFGWSFMNNIVDELYKHAHENTKKQNIARAFRRISEAIGYQESILKSLQEIDVSKVLKEYLDNLTVEDENFKILNDYIIASNLQSIILEINNSFYKKINSVSYVKPIRAMVDRYYRVQGINTKELDADGSNLPMVLNNMSNDELELFENWTKEIFDVVFSIKKNDNGGHVSLIIKDTVDAEEYTNLTDTGYGYSQILPIILHLWMLHNKTNNKNNTFNVRSSEQQIIVIEQPELHLHPAFQEKMIDIFSNIINESKKQKIDIKIIFETHSEPMINRLGYLVSMQELDSNDVNVLIFEKNNGITKVTPKNYDEYGLLKGWPIGFFS